MTYCIGNTHFDPVWLWTWDEALSSIRATFRSALDRMNEYPDYTYSFCTPATFEMIEKIDPALFEEIRERVRDGRWDLSEGWWLQPDCCSALGESYARQGLYGQRYLEEKFGKRTSVMYNIDSFGHPDFIPQYLRGCGIESYVFSRPESYHRELPDPLFLWSSEDGSSVMAYRGADLFQHTPEEVLATVEKYQTDLDEKNTDRMLFYGVTNHGGAPTKAILSALSTEMDKGRALRFSSMEEFFEIQRGKYSNVPGSRSEDGRELPVVTGGINTRDCGVFSNYPEVKQDNRRAEYTALSAERAAVMASLFGESYPLEQLRGVWSDIMFNQFHDILGGASIMQAYRDARDLHGRALQSSSEIMNFALQQITRRIATGDGIWNFVYFNFNATPYEGTLEAELQWCWEYDLYRGDITVTDDDGNELPCQIILERSTIPGFRTRVVFGGTVPPMGYAAYHFNQKGGDVRHSCDGDADVLDGGILTVKTMNENGGVEIRDNRDGSVYAITPEVRADDGDVWSFNTCGFGDALEPFTPISAARTESGDIKNVVRTRFGFRSSNMEQRITVYPGRDYVDIAYRVDWDEPHTALKYRITTPSAPDRIVAGVPGGLCERGFDGEEYPLSETIELGDITVMADSIFAYNTDKDTETAALTLLRNPVCGDLRMDDPLREDEDYLYVGRGIHEGKLRVWLRHGSELSRTAAADRFALPPVWVCEAHHDGELSGIGSFLAYEGTGDVTVDAVKKAEDGSGDIVIRIANRGFAPCDGRLTSAFSGSSLEICLGAHEIRTLRVPDTLTLDEARTVSMLEE